MYTYNLHIVLHIIIKNNSSVIKDVQSVYKKENITFLRPYSFLNYSLGAINLR